MTLFRTRAAFRDSLLWTRNIPLGSVTEGTVAIKGPYGWRKGRSVSVIAEVKPLGNPSDTTFIKSGYTIRRYVSGLLLLTPLL